MKITKIEKPDFEIRGTVLFLMKDNNTGNSLLTPKEFPWFYDKKILTEYFDYLHKNRLNTIFIKSAIFTIEPGMISNLRRNQ